MPLGEFCQVGAFGQILSEETIGVLIAPALPGVAKWNSTFSQALLQHCVSCASTVFLVLARFVNSGEDANQPSRR